MKTKTFGLFALSVLTLVFLMGAVSAVITLYPTSYSASIKQGGSFSFTFTIFNDGGIGNQAVQSITVVPSDLTFGSNTISGSQVSAHGIPTSVQPNSTSPAITVTINVPSAQSLGLYTGTLTVDGIHNDTNATIADKTISLSINVTSEHPIEIQSCTSIPGELSVKSIDFTNNGLSHTTFGDDDEWFPFEEIEVEIDIKAEDYDIDDIEVSWGLYDVGAGEWVIDFDEEDEVNIKEGDTETFTVSFKLDDDDLDVDLEDDLSDDTDNYRLYVVADGTIDDSKSLNDGEDTCAFDYESASMIIESDFVILDNIDMPETLSCGEIVTITADVWNIGDRDQNEVSVEIFGRESALKFRETIEVGDIDEFERQQISFTFTVPKNIDEKFYALKFEVNEDGDVYENDFDDDLSEFTVPFKVEGNCGVGMADVTISATLESEAKAGKEMVIRATVTNNGDELKTFTINAAEFAAWADLLSQDQNTLILNAGQSRDVLFTFDVKKDASGSQTFFIELVSGDDITRQPVSVNIESSRPFLGITGLVTTDNAYLWGIGILNIVLIVIIILVAVRIARRK